MLAPAVGLELLRSVEDRVQGRERARSAAHVGMLREVLALAEVAERAGLGLGVPAQLALLLDASEWRAHDLLEQARVWSGLPGGLAALEVGEFTEEQCRAVTNGLGKLAPPDAERVWLVLRERVRALRAQGVTLPPRRLGELLAKVIAELLPTELAEQERDEPSARVDGPAYELHPDGSGDVHAYGVSGPNVQAALANIARRAQPLGPWDDRTPEQRRRDAITDLLTGRAPLRAPGEDPDSTSRDTSDGDGPEPQGRCGCAVGAQVPCGVGVQVLVPLATALGLSSVPGVVTGPAGPGLLSPTVLTELLLAAPRLSAVFVNQAGVPVALGRGVHVPDRNDPVAVQQALLALLRDRPGEYVPADPDDHPGRHSGPPTPAPAPAPTPTQAAPPATPDHGTRSAPDALDHPEPGGPGGARADGFTGEGAASSARAHGAHGPHEGGPGAYSIRAVLRRVLAVRAVRCEWPGCGARAERCDLDHDRAHPEGATCGCNLGPLCRRHHRIKQQGWAKTRRGDGSVTWTSPTGRSWTSPNQLPPVPTPVPGAGVLPGWLFTSATADQPTADKATADQPTGGAQWADLTPQQQLEELLRTDPLHPDHRDDAGRWLEPDDQDWRRADPDHDPDADRDRLGEQLTDGLGTAWTLDLADPYRWDPALAQLPPRDEPAGLHLSSTDLADDPHA